MIINHNMNAINANRMMGTNITKSGKSMEKLSSGLRINRAGDDAAGLAISEKMRAQIRGLDQAKRNSQDGISMIQTAEGALNETHSILQRMRELATQAANDTNTSEDRGQIQNEINQLTSEINRIGNTTEFNTQKVLDGGDSARKAATGNAPTVDIKTVTEGKAATTPAEAAKLDATAIVVSANTDYATDSVTDLKVSLDIDGETIADIDLDTLEGKDYTAGDIDDLATDLATDINAKIDAYNTANSKNVAHVTVTNDSGKLVVSSGSTGESSSVKFSAPSGGTDALATLKLGTTEAKGTDASGQVAGEYKFTAGKLEEGQSYSLDGKALELTGEGADALKTAIEADTELAAKYEVTVSGEEVTLKQKAGQESATAPNMEIKTAESEDEGFTATLQIGANKGQAFAMSIGDMRAEALGITQKAAGDSETKVETVTEGKAATTPAEAAKLDATAIVVSANTDYATDSVTDLKVSLDIDGETIADIDLDTLEGKDYTAGDIDDLATDLATDINAKIDAYNTANSKNVAHVTVTNDSGKLVVSSGSTGESSSVKFSAPSGGTDALATLKLGTTEAKGTDASGQVAGEYKFTAGKLEEGQSYSIDGKALEVTGEGADALKTAIEADTELAAKYEVTVSGEEVTLKQKAGQESATAPKVEVKTAGEEGEVAFTKDPSVTNGTDSNNVESALDVSTHDNATNAIEVLNNAINKVSTERSKLGAFQNRLEHTINNLGTASENLTAAESRIRDVDMAKEMMEFSKNNILQQASQAMLAQAKQAPQGVLQLLR